MNHLREVNLASRSRRDVTGIFHSAELQERVQSPTRCCGFVGITDPSENQMLGRLPAEKG